MANYYFGQGKVYLAQRLPGQAATTGFVFVGNCPELSLQLGRSAVRFAQGGTETETALIPRGDQSMVRFMLDDFNLQHLANFLSGRSLSVTGAVVLDEPIVARLGRTVPLTNMNITVAPVVTGAGGTPTYTPVTDYEVNMEHGTLTFPTTSTIPDGEPLLVDYTYGNYDKISAFTMKPGYHWLRFEGYNIARTPYTPQVLDVFKVRLRPPAGLPILTNDLRTLDLEATIHYDALQSDNTTDGRMFRIKRYTPA